MKLKIWALGFLFRICLSFGASTGWDEPVAYNSTPVNFQNLIPVKI